MPTAVIVTGSRYAVRSEWGHTIGTALLSLDLQPNDLVIHGACSGIDSIADEMAREININTLAMPAQWNDFGIIAGPIRNKHMLDVLLSLRECSWTAKVLAFHDDFDNSKGTKNMTNQALAKAIPTTLYHSDGTRKELT